MAKNTYSLLVDLDGKDFFALELLQNLLDFDREHYGGLIHKVLVIGTT